MAVKITLSMKKFLNAYLAHLTTIAAILLPVLFLSVILLTYFDYRHAENDATRYAELIAAMNMQSEAASSTATALAQAIEIIKNNLELTKSESAALAGNLSTAQEKVASLESETSKIGGTVGDLEKLSQTDEELLKKYSKIAFLNENYVPKKLSEVRNQYLYSEKKTQYFLTDALPFLTGMIDAAAADGVTIYVKSAYRSFNEQDTLKGAYSVTYGSGANQFSADQGYSEHQLGTTVDLIAPGLGGELSTKFDTTPAYTWLLANAYKYGFVLSYPKGNAYYIYEPWHWRFVSKSLAKKLHDEGKSFYDLDQRTIDGYLLSLFDI